MALPETSNKKESYWLGYSHIEMQIEVFQNTETFKMVEGDTQVNINGKLLCYVSAQERQKFVDELKQIIEKYRI